MDAGLCVSSGNCRLPICDFRFLEIGNRHSAIGNRLVHGPNARWQNVAAFHEPGASRAHWGPRPSGRGGVSHAQDSDYRFMVPMRFYSLEVAAFHEPFVVTRVFGPQLKNNAQGRTRWARTLNLQVRLRPTPA